MTDKNNFENEAMELNTEQLEQVSGGSLDPNVPWARSLVTKDSEIHLLGSSDSQYLGTIWAGSYVYAYKICEVEGWLIFDASQYPNLGRKFAYIRAENVELSGDYHDYKYILRQ